MATYYWGGGSGAWSSTAVTNWYTDAGRTTLATVAPGLNDDVIFDSASSGASYTVTLTATNVRNVSISGPATGTATFSQTGTLNVYGNFTVASTGVTRSGTGATSFRPPTATTVTITSGAWSHYGLDFTGTDNTSVMNLGSAISSGASASFFSGYLNTNGFNITAGSFNIQGTAVRTFMAGTSTISTSYGGTGRWGIALTNLTYDLSSSTILMNATTDFLGGGATYGTVTLVSSTQDITGSSTYGTLNLSATISGNITFAGNNTVGTLNFNGNASAVVRKRIMSSVPGTRRTLNITTATNLQNIDFSDIVVTGSTLSGTNLGDIGNNSGIVFGASRNIYLVGTSTGTSTSFSTSPSGPAETNLYPLAQDNLLITDSALASGATIASPSQRLVVKNLDFSQRTLPVTFGVSTVFNLFVTGDFIFSNAVTASSSNPLTFIGPGNQRIISAGKNLTSSSVTISKSGGQVIQNDSARCGNGLLLYSGTYNMNGYSVTAFYFNMSDSTETANGIFGPNRQIISGGGPMYITGNSDNFLFVTNALSVVTGILDVFLTYSGSLGLRTVRSTSGNISSVLNVNMHVLAGTDGFRLGNSTFCCRDLIFYDAWNGSITTGTTNQYRRLRIPANRTAFNTWTITMTADSGTPLELDTNNSPINTISTVATSTNTLNLSSDLNVVSAFTVSCPFNTNNYNMSVGAITSSSTVTRTMNFGSSTITIAPTSALGFFFNFAATGLTLNAGTSTIILNNINRTGSTTATLNGRTLNKVNVLANQTNSIRFVATGTINELNVIASVPPALELSSDVTLTVGKFTVNSALGRRLYFSATTGTATLVKSGGGFVDIDYADIINLLAFPDSNWYAGTHSTRTGTTSGWVSNYRIKPTKSNFSGFI